jgi:hypothetical protein
VEVPEGKKSGSLSIACKHLHCRMLRPAKQYLASKINRRRDPARLRRNLTESTSWMLTIRFYR